MFLLMLHYDVTKRVAIIMISLFGTIWIGLANSTQTAAKQAYQPAETVVKTFYLSKQVKDDHTIYSFQLANHPSQIVKVTGWPGWHLHPREVALLIVGFQRKAGWVTQRPAVKRVKLLSV